MKLPHAVARALVELGASPIESKLNARLTDDLLDDFRAWQRERERGQSLLGRALSWLRPTPRATVEQRQQQIESLLTFLKHVVAREAERFDSLTRMHTELQRRCAQSANEDEVAEFVLDFARDLGADEGQLRGDREALKRWFGLDAVTDRYVHRRAATERKLDWCLGRLGALSAEWLRGEGDSARQKERWKRLDLERTAAPLLRHEGDGRVAASAFRCLSEALRALGADWAEQLVGDDTVTFIYRAALDSRLPTWIQCEAIDLLQHLSGKSLAQVLEVRLTRPEGGDDLFVRRAAVRVLGANLTKLPDLARLLPTVAADPSPFVRQGLASILVTASEAMARDWLPLLALQDAVPQVRASAIWEGRALAVRPELAGAYLELLAAVFDREQDKFVLRVAIHASAEVVPALNESGVHASRIAIVLAGLDRLHTIAPALAVRRWASQARERIWLGCDEEAIALAQALKTDLAGLKPGQSRSLSWLRRADEARIGRVLAVLAQEDFGYDLTWGWWGARIARGPVFRFRFWRFLHEMRHPDPAKRQAFRHTIGRASDADVRAPSGILAELAETKVPGEPLFIGSESGWRPFLPLPDDFVSCLNRGLFGRPVRFFTSEGVTELVPPRSPFSRLWAHLKLSHSFARLARMRNWQEGDPADPATYLRSLERLGFQVRFSTHAGRTAAQAGRAGGVSPLSLGRAGGVSPLSLGRAGGVSPLSLGRAGGVSPLSGPREADETHSGDSRPPLAQDSGGSRPPLASDPAVARFFPSLVPLASLDGNVHDFAERFTSYFLSAFENSPGELAAFVGLVGAAFLGRAWYLTATMRRARQAIPLVLGGWGTRGKSGTERLKAALINALGHSLVSKTTGCEAMFLYSPAYGKTRELFLYRSYDKATIWEQRMMVLLAKRLGAEVFLWECMGLTPSYVAVLQQSWMRDDLSTLTNTYPDHEDVQGPAGIDIPEVMTNFIPTRSRLITSEEQMRPILSEAAAEKGCSMRSVGWLEAGLIPPDVLGRFPYEEHPYNIALVLAVADELGIGPDFALKEMADRVVPDLGVLKTAPEACVRTRRLRFSNGMSANERHGCLNNWVRLGFDKQDAETEPGVWLSTVVNNRADRIPRSRVFASILVNDLSADRHFLIGGNLSGLMSSIRESWDDWVRNVTLWPETDPNNPLGVLEVHARRFRRPIGETSVTARLKAMLAGMGAEVEPCLDAERLRQTLQEKAVDSALVESTIEHLTADLSSLAEYRALADRLVGHTSAPADGMRNELDVSVREMLWRWFSAKLVVVADYHATGDQIIDLIVARTPPGFVNRVMGIQNIKGTGLDFVYRWEAWGACHRLCSAVRDPDPVRAESALRELALFKDYGIVSEPFVRATLEAVEAGPLGARDSVLEQVGLVRANLEARMAEVRAASQNEARKGGWLASVASAVETVLDVSAALRRKRKANQIYTDLAAGRISQDRAVRELQLVTKKQKGGWLLEWLRGQRG